MQDRLGELLGDGDTTMSDIQLDVMTEEKGFDPTEESIEELEDLKNVTQKIKNNAERIKYLKRQSNKEVTREAQKAIFDELEQNMANTHRLAKEAQSIMTRCRQANVQYAKDHPGAPSLVFRQNMLNTHARQFQQAVEEFQVSSEEFKRALNEKITRQAKIINKDITDEEIDELIASKDLSSMMKTEMMGPHQQVLDRVVEIEERHEGVLRIEEGVKQIQELFQDLAFLVELQGEKLQNVEDNVMKTSEYAKEAVINIQKAEQSGIKARKKQCYIILCCLVILLVILLPTLMATMGDA